MFILINAVKNIKAVHVIACGDFSAIKAELKKELKEHGIFHSVLEFETPEEQCCERECKICFDNNVSYHHCH